MIFVINSQGEQEPFSLDKIHNSIIRTGGSKKIADKISSEIKKMVYPDISTIEIYAMAEKLLKKEEFLLSLKYNLKQAMKKMGPEGFVFEKFIAEIFDKKDFKVSINENLLGKCISHEIDFIAENKKIKYVGECKYRNHTGERIDVNIPMKSFAVREDLLNKDGFKGKTKLKSIVVTNEKFTTKAIQYAKCKKIELLGWNYPIDNGLEKMIQEQKAYPITILPSFKMNHINIFAKKGFLLVSDLKDKDILTLERYKIPTKHLRQLIKEAKSFN